MNAPDPNDEVLRSLLGQVGRQHENLAPPFQPFWRKVQGARLEGGKRISRPVLTLFAAAAALAVIAIVAFRQLPRAQDDFAMDGQPTDFLLTAGEDSDSLMIDQLSHEIEALLRP